MDGDGDLKDTIEEREWRELIVRSNEPQIQDLECIYDAKRSSYEYHDWKESEVYQACKYTVPRFHKVMITDHKVTKICAMITHLRRNPE